MRGSPILRAVLVFVALLALAPLLWKMTRPVLADTVPEHLLDLHEIVDVRLNFTTAATRVEIQHLGRKVWSKATPAVAETLAVKIPWPNEGVDLRVIAAWPEGTRSAAMRVRLTAPDGTEYDRTVWGDATADDVLKFP